MSTSLFKRTIGAVGFVMVLSMAVTFTLGNNSSSALSGSEFKAGRIIDDAYFYNGTTMSAAEIQNFLNAKVPTCDTNGSQGPYYDKNGKRWDTRADYGRAHGSPPPYTCIKSYKQDTGYKAGASGLCSAIGAKTGRTAAQIIDDVARACHISQKAILVMLQKEQGLVTDDWPWPIQYRSAMGYGCPDTAACDSEYYGFFNQVYNAALQFQRYKADPYSWNHVPFMTNQILYQANAPECGSRATYIENYATAGLYNYTPYTPNQAALDNLYGSGNGCSAYGNRNFWRYYNDWFGSSVNAPPSNVFMRDGTYSLVNLASRKGLDAEGGRSSNGTPVQIYDLNNTPAQDWHISRDTSGYYTFKNVSSGRYLDVKDGGTRTGSGVQIWDGNGSCAQKWSIISFGKYYHLLSKCSGYALDVTGGQTSNGSKMQLWEKNSSGAQLWSFNSKESTSTYNGFFEIKTNSGMTMDITNGSTANGTRVQIYGSNQTQTQFWHVTGHPDGFYTIRNPLSGRYLDVINASSASGTGIQIFNKNISCAQKWIISGNNSTGHTILSACSGKAVDVQNGNISIPGTPIQIYESNGSAAQKWYFTKTLSNPLQGQYSILTLGGMAIEITGGKTADGTSVQTWDNNGTAAQRWQLAKKSDASYSAVNPASGKYMDVKGGVIAQSTPIHIWAANTTCAQKWNIADNNNGTFRLQSACPGNLALDVKGGAINTAGTKLQLFSTNGSGSQSFIFANP